MRQFLARVSSRVFVASTIAGCACVGVVRVAAQDDRPQPLAQLDIVLTVATRVSDQTRIDLMKEAAALWRRASVDLQWLPSPSSSDAIKDIRMRVLVVGRPVTEGDDRAQVAGELLRLNRGRALAFASIDQAQRIVAGTRPFWFTREPGLEEHYLGVVLGRVVAHELGHYLLDTRTHAQNGLMRPHFDAREFADPRSGAFALDRDAIAWVHDRLSRGIPLGPATLNGDD